MNTNEEKEQPLPQWLRALAEKAKQFGRLPNYDGELHRRLIEAADELEAGRTALRAESEPVLWQFYDDGKWFNCLNEQHRKNTEADGYEMRPLYTAPQTEPKDTGSEI